MTEWKTYKVGDIIDEIAMGPFGSNIKVDNFKLYGEKVIDELEKFEKYDEDGNIQELKQKL